MLFDIICVLVILAGGALGWFKGLFKMASRLVGIICAFLVTLACVGSVCSFLYDGLVAPQIQNLMLSKIEELGAEETVNQVYTLISDVQNNLHLEELAKKGTELGSQVGSAIENIPEIDNLKSSYDNLSEFIDGISPSVLNFIADKVDISQIQEISDNIPTTTAPGDKLTASQKVAISLTNTLRTPMITFLTPMCFGVLFFILAFVCIFLFNFLAKLLEKIKIVEMASHISGACIGGICAVAVVILLAFICNLLVTPATALYSYTENSVAIDATNSLINWVVSSNINNSLISDLADAMHTGIIGSSLEGLSSVPTNS